MGEPASGGADRARVGRGRHLALSTGWFGMNFHWLPLNFVLIQAQVRGLVPRADVPVGIGLVAGLGGVLAVTVPPLTGLISDHLRTPWGRRRPVIVVGLVGNLAGLAIMAMAGSYKQLVAGYLTVQLFNNAVGAAYAGIVPDLVPQAEFGWASGLLAAMFNLGGILGVGTTLAMSSLGALTATYGVIAVVIVASFLPVLRVAGAEALRPVLPPSRPPIGVALRALLRPLFGGDFAWVVMTRLLVASGITVVSYFLSPFFADVVKVPNPDQFTSLWLLLVFAAAIPFGLVGGGVSDRIGRKLFVYGSGSFQALVAAVFIVFYPTNPLVLLLLGAVYGLAYGLYYAVDWALACDTLPDARATAKDMGLFHIAYVLPQVVVPLVGGVLIEVLSAISPGNGYRAVFALSIVFMALGTLLVSRIRTVR